MRRSVAALLLCWWANGQLLLANDELVVRSPRGGRVTVQGTVVDYTGRKLVFRNEAGAQATREYDLAEVLEVRTAFGARHEKALQRWEQDTHERALEEWYDAVREEPRAWVQRELLAVVVKRLLQRGDTVNAGDAFLRILDSDPFPAAVRLAPLGWLPAVPSAAVVAAAQRWMRHKTAVGRLLGASWLLMVPESAAEARAVIRELASESEPMVFHLAQTQQWRLRRDQGAISAAILQRWEQTLQRAPERWQNGAWSVLGDAQAEAQQFDLAIASWLRVSLLYRDDLTLAADCQVRAVRMLVQTAAWDDAATAFRVLEDRFQNVPQQTREELRAAIVDRRPPKNSAASPEKRPRD